MLKFVFLLQVIAHMRVLNLYDVDDVAHALIALNGKFDDFNQYPGRYVWLKNMIWFHSMKFPLFQQVIRIDEQLDQIPRRYTEINNNTRILRDKINDALYQVQHLANIFYTPGDINTLKMMARNNSFYGYRPEIEIEMHKVLLDFLIDLKEKPELREKPHNMLNEIGEMSIQIAGDIRNIAKNSSITRATQQINRKFIDLFDMIEDLIELVEPYNIAQNQLAKRTKNAFPLTAKPELGNPIDVSSDLQKFRSEFENIVSDQVVHEFETLWTNNNDMSTEFLSIVLKVKDAYKNLIQFKDHQQDQYYQLIGLSFQGIMFVVQQICARMEKLNLRIYFLITSAINVSADKSDSKIISIIQSDNYDFGKFFANANKKLNGVPKLTETLSFKVNEILPSFNVEKMREFNTDFQSIMSKLRDVQYIVVDKTCRILN